jgi:hypothetical protein
MGGEDEKERLEAVWKCWLMMNKEVGQKGKALGFSQKG